jgi:CheY-like chemotaxis protein
MSAVNGSETSLSALQTAREDRVMSHQLKNNKRDLIQRSLTVPPKSYHILIVDDSIPNRKMLNRLLTREHHIVTEASDGDIAVELMQNLIQDREKAKLSLINRKSAMHERNANTENAVTSLVSAEYEPLSTDRTMKQDELSNDPIQIPPMFDLILMDYYMPNMTGPLAIEQIRKLGYEGMIVGVSGVMDDDVNHFIQAGANLVLCKPISLAALWKALRDTDFFDNQE